MPLAEVCSARSGNSKIIKGTLATQNDGNLFPAYSATGQDVFSDGFDFDGDGIVISAVGARCGKCFLANGKWRAIANTHVVLPKPDKADVRFLWYLLNDESFWVKGGTAQPFVKVGDSLKKQIAVPPLAEQERIVKLLDEADVLRKLRAQTDRRTAALIPALFHEMFGDPVANPKSWPVAKLADVAPLKSGFAFKSTDYQANGVRLVRISNLDGRRLVFGESTAFLPESFLEEYSSSQLAPGDVLIAMSGATTGKLGMVESADVPSLLNQPDRVRRRTTPTRPCALELRKDRGIRRSRWRVEVAWLSGLVQCRQANLPKRRGLSVHRPRVFRCRPGG